MKRKIGLGLMAVAGAILALPGIAAAQSGSVGGRPAYPREDNPRSQSIFIHTLKPGDSVSDGVNVVNNSTDPKTVEIYAVDPVVSSGGAFACAQKVDAKTGVGSWVVLDKQETTLAPASSEVVNFKVTVPEQADVGEHDGCIIVQEKKESNNESGIGLSFRTGVRIAILVPGEIIKELKFTGLGIQQQKDKTVIAPSLENTGNVSLDVDINTKITDMFGKVVAENNGQFVAFAKRIGDWNIEHDRPFWGGWYYASAEATYDTNTSQFIGDPAKNNKTLVGPKKMFFIPPQPRALAVELGGLAAVLAGIGYIVLRARSALNVKRTWETYKVKKSDDIHSVAERHHVSWKKLARANRLKAPYTLKKDQIIKIPPQA